MKKKIIDKFTEDFGAVEFFSENIGRRAVRLRDISSALSEQKQEFKKMVDGLKKELNPEDAMEKWIQHKGIYNQALTDILNKLNNL